MRIRNPFSKKEKQEQTDIEQHLMIKEIRDNKCFFLLDQHQVKAILELNADQAKEKSIFNYNKNIESIIFNTKNSINSACEKGLRILTITDKNIFKCKELRDALYSNGFGIGYLSKEGDLLQEEHLDKAVSMEISW